MRRSVASALVLFIVLALVAVAGLGGYEYLKVSVIEVSGAEYFSRDEITSLAGIPPDVNIFLLDESKIRENINQDPRVQFESLERVLPDKIILHVQERLSACVTKYTNSYLLLDKDGFVLEIAEDDAPGGYPLVVGLGISGVSVGDRLEVTDVYQLNLLRDLITSINASDLKAAVNKIDLSEPANLTMDIAPGFTIKLGDNSNIHNKLNWAISVVPELLGRGITSGVVDVSSGQSAVYMPD